MTQRRSQAFLLFLLVLGLSASAVVAAVDDVLGKWEGTVESRQGPADVTLEFQGTEGALEGTWTGPRGTSELDNVQFEEGQLTFVRHLEMRGRKLELDCVATLEGDTLDVVMKTPRGEREFTLNRAK
ncbi:MAG: hypothetical protein AAGK22_08925 [Acidobacteriota bacterium]